MGKLEIERRGPSRWPWLVGLVVLALLVWGITTLIQAPDPEVAGEGQIAEQLETPAAVPAAGTEEPDAADPQPAPDTDTSAAAPEPGSER